MKIKFLYSVFFILCFSSIGYSQSISSLGGGVTLYGTIYAMQFDSSNNKLYIGGEFKSIEGITVNNVAMWDGISWHSLLNGTDGEVLSMKLVGSDLYIGGYFHNAGGVSTSNIAKWDGSNWTQVGQGLNYVVDNIEYFKNKIYVTGFVPYTSNFYLLSFDGVNWSPNLGTFDRNTEGMLVKDTSLIIYGAFQHFNSDSVTGIINYDGMNAHYYPGVFRYGINSMTTINNNLYALSGFGDSIYYWNGTNWMVSYLNTSQDLQIKKIFNRNDSLYLLADSNSHLPNSPEYYNMMKIENGTLSNTIMRMRWNNQINQSINSIITSGNSIFIGGGFNRCDDTLAISLLNFNGSQWSNPGKPCSANSYIDPWFNCSVNTIVKDSSSSDIFIGGSFYFANNQLATNVARWDGSSWHSVGTGLSSRVNKLIYFRNELYAFGNFARAGTQLVNSMAKWNGSQWIAIGGTGPVGWNNATGAIYDALVLNNELYICGSFMSINGISANFVAKYDGTNWSPVGDNVLDNTVQCLSVFNGNLIAGGQIEFFFGSTTSSVAFLNQSGYWQTMGTNFPRGALSFLIYNNQLYGSGGESPSGATVYRWNGADWILIATTGGSWDSGKLYEFNNQICLTISNYGFFIYDGTGFNLAAQFQPYAFLKDSNTTYVGGFIPYLYFGLVRDTINDIGTLSFTLPQVNISSNTDTICERQYVFFNSQTTDIFAHMHWYFPGGNPDTLSVPSPIIQYNTIGTYPVYLITTNLVGTDTIFLSQDIYVRHCNVGTGEINSDDYLSAYPNPFTNSIYLKTDQPQYQIRISDITGKVIRLTEYYSSTQLDLSEIKQGIYLLTFNSEKFTRTFKIIKQ